MSVNWSVSAGWSAVLQSLILSIIAVCWVWTRFRIKRLSTLSCFRPTNGPTRLLLVLHLQLLVEKSFRHARKLWGKTYSTGKISLCWHKRRKTFIIYCIQTSSHYLSNLSALSCCLTALYSACPLFDYWFIDRFILHYNSSFLFLSGDDACICL